MVIAISLFTTYEAITAEEADAAVSKKVIKKAKKYKKKANKIFKVGGAKYCFSKKKVKKGVQKVGGKYYFFNKSTGKMMTNYALKSGSKYYFFQASGVRYNHKYNKSN